MQGYFRDLAATRSVTTPDGWLDTGDMGYLMNGELVITGRSKDLIICNGRNIWPHDLEWAVERLDGIRPGDVAAFSVERDGDGEKVIVVIECREASLAAQQILRQVARAAVQRVAGIECEIVLATPGSLTFTTSGKLSRAAAKAKYLGAAIRDVAAPAEGTNQRPELQQIYAVAS